MTLCLAWRNGTTAYFASDSRLTDPQKTVTSDEATKIFKIDVAIYDPTPEGTDDEPALRHRTNYGLCFSGSYMNGSLLSDAIEEILSNIQAVDGISDVSIENLSNIAFAIFRRVSEHLMSINGKYGLSSVLFGGHCLEMGVFKLFKFSSIQEESGQPITFNKKEMELADAPIYIGDQDAITKANELTALIKPGYTYFHLLRDIIKDHDFPLVGGKMQAGEFKWNTFKTNGIIEYSLEPDTQGIKQVKTHFNYRGLSLDLNDNELRSGNINIMKTFFDPFVAERMELFKESEESIEKWSDKMEADTKRKSG